eukprot:2004924-Lingulodinium_polyedra.AAC.1
MTESTLRGRASRCSVGMRVRARSLDAWRRTVSFTAACLTPRGGVSGMLGAMRARCATRDTVHVTRVELPRGSCNCCFGLHLR